MQASARTLFVSALGGLLAALGLMAALGGFFDQYRGQAVAWSPVEGNDRLLRLVVEAEDHSWVVRELPASAVEGLELPRGTLPPAKTPEAAVPVIKSVGFTAVVGERAVPTLPAWLWTAPLVLPLLVVLAVNTLRTGSPVKMDGTAPLAGVPRSRGFTPVVDEQDPPPAPPGPKGPAPKAPPRVQGPPRAQPRRGRPPR